LQSGGETRLTAFLYTKEIFMTPFYQQMTSLGSATAPTIPAGCRFALFQAETQAVRYRVDGVDPTASVGMRLLTTDPPRAISIEEGLLAIKFIAETGSPKVNITYFV